MLTSGICPRFSCVHFLTESLSLTLKRIESTRLPCQLTSGIHLSLVPAALSLQAEAVFIVPRFLHGFGEYKLRSLCLHGRPFAD